MAVPDMRGSRPLAAMTLLLAASAFSIRADEIRLKDGKKLNGVIVAYEDNMFKVKTDFGYVLVEKDKIASIIPSTPAKGKTDSQPTAKKDAAPATKSPSDAQPTLEPASVTSVDPAPATKREKPSAKLDVSAVKPDAPANATAAAATAPKIKSTTTPPSGLSTAAAAPAPPKEPEVPANREEIQGNLYTNYTHGFRMYKAPSWNPIEEARNALPNAIVAMGTLNQSTMLVIGQEKTKEPLPAAATTVEKRLREVYENYRQISQRKTLVGGLPGIEYRYRGLADDHDWSGTLVVISRGNDIFTVLGMTYADTDLIQIQENVISRSISSLDFNVH
jgi:hypothetical protein